MPEMICAACNKKLASITGYSQHLAKTTNSACCAIYLSSQQFAPDPLNDGDIDLRDVPDQNHSPDFEGDFFGTYAEDELAWPGSDDEGDVNNAPVDADDSDHDITNHDEWEPPVVPAPAIHSAFVCYPDQQAGQPTEVTKQLSNATYYAQLNNLSSSSTAFSELLSIDGHLQLSEKIGLSFKNAWELNKIIDEELPGHPKFKHDQIIVANEAFDIYYHDIIECIKALFSDPNFADFLVFAPKHHYADEDETICLYHKMHTGKWWWNSQKHLDHEHPGAIIIPVIISSDKTQYMTIRNIPKEIHQKLSCQAHVLLAYLPTTHLKHITNKAACRCMLANLYHASMHQGHPLFTCFAGDYPEQVLATGVKTTQCANCDVPSNKLSLAASVRNS
ncbi:hypothetical protein BDR05DRAFT_971751 [Suillus weaverae]|nr:hypothetical protein BDR05DRAFT_971751 [Suillus weaverae]